MDVGAAIPAEPIEPIVLNGVRRDVTLDPILLDILDEDEVGKVLAGMNANRVRSQKASEARGIKRRISSARKAGQDTLELERSLEEAEQAVEDAERLQSDILGSDVSLLLPLPGYEAIPAGAVLNHRMFLKNVSDVQLGLFMAGLARFAEDPRFGAHRAHGCGQVCMEYRIKRIEGASAHPVGDLAIDPDRWHDDESSLSLSDQLAEWLDAWNASSQTA